MAAADLGLVGHDARDVIGVPARQVRVEVVERHAHGFGMLLVRAEDDGFVEAVRAFEVFREMGRDGLGAP